MDTAQELQSPSFHTLAQSAHLSDEQIWADLKALMGSEQVLTRLIERTAHAGDASIYRLMPRVVVMPRTEEDVRKLLAYCVQQGLHVTFRAAGTSLSGQAVTDGILVSLGRHWKGYQILEQGRAVAAQPGVVGGQLNNVLARYGYKIGPDPASINAAMIGGIAANNASGLCCGITQNTYRTLRSMRVMLADGFLLDSAAPDAGEQLKRARPDLVQGLLKLRQDILSDPELVARIRRKYQIKNTTGYSLNALVDFEDPVDILTHLMVGSEGTLGFLSEIRLETIPLPKCWATTVIFFKDLADVGQVVFSLRELGAAVVEFMDKASMKSVQSDMKYAFEMTPNCAALLVEFQEAQEDALRRKVKEAQGLLVPERLLERCEFTRETALRDHYWHMRKGLFPSAGAMRRMGTAVIIEDVVFPVHRSPEAIPELQALILRSGFPDGILFGHAKEGNYHPVVTQDFSDPKMVETFGRFMSDLADLVLNRYDGSFKGEHGTGRNVAPFVEMEWGQKAYQLMVRIKELFDPQGILNPGVLINHDPQIHLKNLKQMPTFFPQADPCIECGFCEIRCPSHDLTLSPRQRIVVRRQIEELSRSSQDEARRQARLLEREYRYYGEETCAVDGMCATACPVKINTGDLIKALREQQHSSFERWLANTLAGHFAWAVRGVRTALTVAAVVEKLAGPQALRLLTRGISAITAGMIPALPADVPLPRSAPALPSVKPGVSERTVVYFPSCLTRAMGQLPGEVAPEGLAQTILWILHHYGWSVVYPDHLSSLCCGQPFSSKGFPAAAGVMMQRLVDALDQATQGGKWPVVCDTSPCTGQMLSARQYLVEPALSKWKRLKIFDLSTFLLKDVLPGGPTPRKLPVHAILHPTCTIQKIGAERDFVQLAEHCAEKVTVPVMAECCGFAGDRGFLRPELTAAATAPEAREVREIVEADCCRFYSTCRTCEIGMSAATGRLYQSIAYLVAEAIHSAP